MSGHRSHLHRHAARAPTVSDLTNNLFGSGSSNGNSHAKMGSQRNERDASNFATVVSVVYVTATPTFDGPIAGYSTQGVGNNNKVSTTQTPTIQTPTIQTPTTPSKVQIQTTSSSTVEESSTQQTSASPTSSEITNAITAASTTVPTTMGLVVATNSDPQAQSTPASAESATSTPESSASSSGGITTGAKIGVAIGGLLFFAAILSLILFCFKKRKDKMKKQPKVDDEKNPFTDSNNIQGSFANKALPAPRLSLRPVTQFLPNYGEKRQSGSDEIQLSATSPPDQNRSNPFGNHAEAIDSTNANGPPVVDRIGSQGEIITAGTVAAAATTGAAAAGLSRSTSKGGYQQSFIRSGPPSPNGTIFSETETSAPPQTNTGAAIAAAGGPQNSTVHRVQLDFTPSMEDELELHAGQLIRLLHEYDDGWAMCIRLDRSRQGVAPRSCLSTRPVKPRPQQGGPRAQTPGMRPQGPPRGPARGPGMNQGQRPMSPGMHQPRPISPANQGRAASPAMGQDLERGVSPAPLRPMTPTGQTSSPGQFARRMPVTPQKAVTEPKDTPLPPTPSKSPRCSDSPPPPAPHDRQAETSAPAPESSLSNTAPSRDGTLSPVSSIGSRSPPPSLMIGRKPVPGQAL